MKITPRFPKAIDETATHFKAVMRDNGGFFITLYRHREVYPAYGQTECQCTPEIVARDSSCHYCVNKQHGVRPQYKGPMGWKFHFADKDPTEADLYPIDRLYEITGDKPDGSEYDDQNLYAAY